MYVALIPRNGDMNLVKRISNLPTELVVDTREVLEARPRSQPPEQNTRDDRDDDDRWDNAPCTD